MPYYRYRALDSKGQPLEGTIDAPNPQEAAQKLQQRGFRVQSLIDPNPPAPVINAISQPQQFQSPYQRWRATDKQRHFILAQMSDLLRAGVNPANGFLTLSQQQRNPGVADSLKRMAQFSAEGKRISDVMALYPNVYPEHVLGITRAGELGGFLPEALMIASDQAKSTHRFKMWHWFVYLVIINLVLSLPLPFIAFAGFEGSFWKMWNGTGTVTSGWVFKEFFASIGEKLIWPIGPVCAFFYLLLGGIWWYFSLDRAKMKRHYIGYSYSFLGKRTRLEGASLFAWALSRLSRAGHTPKTSWAMACDTIPNLVMRAQMVEAGSMMHEGSSLSEALARTQVLPEEFGSMVVTGEMIGNVPATFERLYNTTKTEFETQTSYSQARTGCWGCLGIFIAIAATTGLVFYLYGEMLKHIMERT